MAAVLALAGCGGVTVYPVHVTGPYDTMEFDYAAGGRDLATVVIGNPFGGDDAAFAARVTGLLNERNTRQPTNFTTAPGPSARRNYKVVLLFNRDARELENTLCRDTATLRGGPARTAPITVQAGFCNGDASLVDVYASAPDGSRPEIFRELIEEVESALFPLRLRMKLARAGE